MKFFTKKPKRLSLLTNHPVIPKTFSIWLINAGCDHSKLTRCPALQWANLPSPSTAGTCRGSSQTYLFAGGEEEITQVFSAAFCCSLCVSQGLFLCSAHNGGCLPTCRKHTGNCKCVKGMVLGDPWQNEARNPSSGSLPYPARQVICF